MRPLSSSSLIDLVAPGSSVTEAQVQKAVTKVESLGFKARVDYCVMDSTGSSPLRSPHLGSLKTPDISKKFQCLKKALTAPDSEAVWCVRGGYGSQKLMPYFLKMKKPVKPKIFIGYSDVTVIHTFLNLKWKWPSLHFPVLTHVKEGSAAPLRRFKDLITGAQKQQHFLKLRLLNPKRMSERNRSVGRKQNAGNKKKLHSYLVGGNLSLVQSSIGTSWAGSFQNKILFLEDIGEAPYRLDRALWQMLNAGVFKGIKALLLGDFIYSNIKRERNEIKQVFKSFADSVAFPVVEGVPCGHGSKKEVLPFMTSCRLHIQSDGKAQLRIAGPFVKK